MADSSANTGTPVVSIGLPVYNGARWLPETIDSILGQTFRDFELVISDNASTDDTQAVCEAYAARDSRVRYERLPENRGAAYNYNAVFHRSVAPLFKWAGHDDLLDPTYLEACVAAFRQSGPDVIIAFPKTRIINEHGAWVEDFEDRLDLRGDDPVERLCRFSRQFRLCSPCFGVIRRDVLARTPLIAPYVSSDVPLLAELSLLGKFWELPERLFSRRVHDESSRQGRTTIAQVARWFHPKARRPWMPVRMMLFFEIHKAILRSPLPAATRARAAVAFSVAWIGRRVRVALGRWRRRLLPSRINGISTQEN